MHGDDYNRDIMVIDIDGQFNGRKWKQERRPLKSYNEIIMRCMISS